MSKRTSVCAFIYADTRHCRMPHASGSRYCEYHRRKLQPLQSQGKLAASLFAPIGQGFVPVTGLSQSLARLFACVADGTVKAKDAVAMARVAETLLKTIPLSDAEFNDIFRVTYRKQLLEDSFGELPDYNPPKSEQKQEEHDQDNDQDSHAPANGTNASPTEQAPTQPAPAPQPSPQQAALAALPGGPPLPNTASAFIRKLGL